MFKLVFGVEILRGSSEPSLSCLSDFCGKNGKNINVFNFYSSFLEVDIFCL